MLTSDYIKEVLGRLQAFQNPETQILEGNGYDGVLDIIKNSRSIEYPCVILESGGSGTLQVIEGPVDTYSQSLWVMDRLGREESEALIYAKMKNLTRLVAAILLNDGLTNERPESSSITWQQVSYMQRYGGPDVRGYEIIFTFKENISLQVTANDLK